MYALYYTPGAASLVVHWLLIELGLEHELRRVDMEAREQKSAEYLALNPNGLVPTLIVDGRPHYEAAALAMYLADRHPQAGFAPALDDPQRAEYAQWMFNLVSTLQAPARLWWYPWDLQADDAAVRAGAQARIEAACERYDAQLAQRGPYLLGERLSVADFYLTMLMRWTRNLPKPAHDWPHLAEYARRMKARPSFKTLYEREGLSEWA
ncbi:glutathione S-transferase family protein [Lysobacter sp. BMK333-48F3]|uniref:glutathione S-transferase family protein n=1 Tax=Lysobacter sp. BMK333-48F3 TaxID=2867962 RepID=UPI001C8BB04F|nr:glutathione S-transferase family protein [Lysobacter sp. BMK333-48F3]MBX9403612.1 glutathione S-transferase family protein [Lysobacter sp. BMK333-48F3]